VVVDQQSQRVICTHFCEGNRHDFKLYQSSKVKPLKETEMKVDSGYQGVQHDHPKTSLPIKKRKDQALTSEAKSVNQKRASERALNEHVIGRLKRFKIISCRYRNRRKRFSLRFNLIAGIHNFELGL